MVTKTMKALIGRLSKMKKRRKISNPEPKSKIRKYNPEKKFGWEDGDIIIEKTEVGE